MTAPQRLDAALLKKHPLPEVGSGDKDERGSILIIAGSRDVAGAPLLTALSAMRAGAGRLQIATVESAAPPPRRLDARSDGGGHGAGP